MSTIPASELVAVVPSVLAVGGSSLNVTGLFLTDSTRPPIGAVQSFPDAAAVADYFGDSSHEAALAAIYFSGFEGASRLPAALLFAQYPADAVGAYLRGGDISALTLAELQALGGALSVVIDGVTKSGTVSLSAATSFSSAAQIIADALDIEGAEAASFTGDISGTTLTISAVASGTLAVGQLVNGTGVTAGTYISALASGTGGTGTYTVSPSQTAISAAMTSNAPGVSYDSVSGAIVIASNTTGVASTIGYGSGALATSLLLTAVTGAILSQGADAAVPAAFMSDLLEVSMDWVTFMTTFDPDAEGENTVKQAFAAWNTLQENRFAYVCSDSDVTPTETLPATGSLGYILANNGNSGTCLVWEADGQDFAAFVCGAAASINFEERNGRIMFAYKAQAGLQGDVTTSTVATNLGGSPQTSNRGNGYNFYGAYGTANNGFVWLQRGFVTGDFAWLDSYINEIWLNSRFQDALLTLQQNSRSIPYTVNGTALIESALADPISAGLNFGAFGPGPLSASQIAAVNNAAGSDVAGNLQTQGYYLQILPATAAVRAARTSPPCKFWYLDSGSVQAITLASIALQ